MNNKKTLRDVYELGHPGFSGRATTPVLFDTKTQTVVSNESAEILRMFNFEFNEFAKNPSVNFYPEQLRSSIDEVNSWVFPHINDGVSDVVLQQIRRHVSALSVFTLFTFYLKMSLHSTISLNTYRKLMACLFWKYGCHQSKIDSSSRSFPCNFRILFSASQQRCEI